MPRTSAASRTRSAGRIAIENPSHYLALDGHDWDEIDFLAELARRSGCGLLLDVNNVFVSARNLGGSAEAYVDAFPGEPVMEIHLAGHSADPRSGRRCWSIRTTRRWRRKSGRCMNA